MKAEATAENIVPLQITTQPRRPEARVDRFVIQEYTNPRTGSTSWRVTGTKRDGSRVRQNYKDAESARMKRNELDKDFLKGFTTPDEFKKTILNDRQLNVATTAIMRMGDEWEKLVDAVDAWKNREQEPEVESPRLDDAVKQFTDWLDSRECDLADHTKRGYRLRAEMFGNATKNVLVSEIQPKTIKDYLQTRSSAVGKTTVKNDKRAICRFLSWCVEKEWIKVNPALGPRQRTPKGGKLHGKLPEIFTVDQCEKLLRAAEKYEKGMLVPYVAVCLFAGLRPDSEAERITWKQVNLSDRQITIEPWITKTGIPRTIKIDDTLHAWLTAYKGKEFYPSGWRKRFDKVKKAAKITKWIVDGMRHAAHSHYFRKCGSYGLTSEFFGNSEGIVRRSYVNRVSTEEMEKFYALMPKKKKK